MSIFDYSDKLLVIVEYAVGPLNPPMLGDLEWLDGPMEGWQAVKGIFRESGLWQKYMRKDTSRIRGTTPEVEQAARRLRKEPTRAEVCLWQALRRRQLAGLKFRFQYPVGRFIADFCCPSLKLIIEIDGGIHGQQKQYDEARTRQLQAFGYRVLRFSNEEVLTNLANVLTQIHHQAQTDFPPESGG